MSADLAAVPVARDQTVDRIPLGAAGAVVLLVDVDPERLDEHQRRALLRLRAAADALRGWTGSWGVDA